MRRFSTLCLGVICFLGGWCGRPSNAAAAMITETFSGVVTFGNFGDFANFPGSTILGTFSYDTSTTPSASSTATTGIYNTGTLSLSVPSQGWSFQTVASNFNNISVVHMSGVKDQFTLSSTGIDFKGEYGEAAIVTLLDPTGTTFSSTSLPTALNFGPVSIISLQFSGHMAFSSFAANITSLANVSIPEPGSLILLGLGVVLTYAGRMRPGPRPLGTARRG